MTAYNGGPEGNNSGGVFERIIHHKIFITEYNSLVGSSYIPLPKELRNSMKGMVNPINKIDNECFRWCHLILKYRNKQYINQLDYTGVTFPVTEKQYKRTEEQNQISVNVFGYENGETFPLYISNKRFEDIIDLLLIEEDGVRHYVLIQDFNRCMLNKTKHEGRKHFGRYCFQCFTTSEILKNHTEVCLEINL